MEDTIRILLVDDEPALLDIARIFIERIEDFKVTTCSSAFDALQVLEKDRFDVIISDYEMPGMDGIEFLKKIRSEENKIPFIIFTGRGREEVVIEALNEGADFYLQKGGQPKAQFAELAHKIRSAVDRKRTEKAFRESELFLKETQAIARLGGWKANPHTDYLEWTDGIYDIIKAPRNYRPGLTEGMKYYAPEDIPVILEKVASCLSTGEPFTIEARIITETGKMVWTELRGLAPVIEGARSYVIGTLQDIGERKIVDNELRTSYEQISATEEKLRANMEELKRQEQALREREMQLRVTLDSTVHGILAVDNNGKVLLFNRRLAEVLKISPSVLESGSDQALLDITRHQLTDPDVFLQKVRSLYDSDAVDLDTLTFRDNRIIERYSFPMIMDGRRIGRVWSFRDITGQKLAEDALTESELLFREVFNNANDAVFLLERTPAGPGNYILVNYKAVRMLGYSKEELLEMSPRDIVPEDIQEKIIPEVMKKLRKDGHATFESAHRRKDGSVYPIEVSTHTFRYKGKDVDLSIIRDITERKKAEKALLQVNRKLNLLSGVTRHDIKNQLIVQRGYLELIGETRIDPSQEEYFRNVSIAAQRISAMIEFTKEYEEIGIHAPIWQDWRILIDTAIKEVPVGKVVVMNDLPPGTEVFADPLITKVCYNLVDNAVRYGGKITTIRFSVTGCDGDTITCEDDGVGIPDEEKEKIFERGFGKNTGMGLFLSWEILSITGITVKETGEPGKGARFEITMPKGTYRLNTNADIYRGISP